MPGTGTTGDLIAYSWVEEKMWTFILWLILLVVAWPLALLALVLYPIVWLLLLPFRLIGITVDAVFKFLHSILLLPSRVLRGPVRA
jgi:hypothetical protein